MTQHSVRRLLGAGFVDYLGSGLFLAFSAVYYTEVVGLSVGSVGLGLGLAGCVALLAAAPLGKLADRVGVRRTLVALHLARAAGTASYAIIGEWWGFLAAVTVVTVTEQSITALTQAFVAELASGERRAKVLATYRTIANVGITLGGPLGGLILGAGAVKVPLLVNAAAYVVVAGVLATVGERRGAAAPAPGLVALRDGRLLRLAAVDTLLQLWLPVLNLGFPLWLAASGTVPKAWVGALYAVNTVTGVLLQIPVARLARTVASARRCQVAGAVLLAAACLLYWAAAGWWPLFVVANVVLTFGELVSVSAAWTLSYAIAPDDRRAEYLAAFGMGRAFGRYVLGPVLVTALLQGLGGGTWGVLAALFAVAAVVTPLVSRPLVGDASAVRAPQAGQ